MGYIIKYTESKRIADILFCMLLVDNTVINKWSYKTKIDVANMIVNQEATDNTKLAVSCILQLENSEEYLIHAELLL
jgi:hypothetical protein